MRLLLVVIVGAVAVLVALIARGAGALVADRTGRLILFGGLAILPLVITAAGVQVGIHESAHTSFCLSCHEMEGHGKSLFVDNATSLAAVHYQKRLINRDTTCYACHADYAMFGNARTKLNGLRHVWVHYLGKPPQRLALYRPYPNNNCLHCHADARPFLENRLHQTHRAELESGARSCLSCHTVAHDLEGVRARNFWQPE